MLHTLHTQYPYIDEALLSLLRQRRFDDVQNLAREIGEADKLQVSKSLAWALSQAIPPRTEPEPEDTRKLGGRI